MLDGFSQDQMKARSKNGEQRFYEMSCLKQQSHYFIRSDSVAAVIRLPVGCTFFHITTPIPKHLRELTY